MKITLQLLNGAGVLDTRELDTGDNDSAEVSQDIWSALDDAAWILAPGDTILIIER
jgi:hypothetical protein